MRKQETHESPGIVSLCLGGLLFSLLPDMRQIFNVSLYQTDKRKGKNNTVQVSGSLGRLLLTATPPLPTQPPGPLTRLLVSIHLVTLGGSCRESPPLLVFLRSAWNTVKVEDCCQLHSLSVSESPVA